MRICSTCKVEKPLSEFNFKNKERGLLHGYCKECAAIKQAKWYRSVSEKHKANVRQRTQKIRKEQRQWIWDYLKIHPCIDCGEPDPTVLDFDHVRDSKIMEVSNMIRHGYSLQKIEEEIEKCEVRCANCHRRKTAREQNWYRTLGS